MRKLVLVALFGALASTASAQSPSVTGTWLTASGMAQVRIGPCPDPANGPICGLVVGLINPKGPDGKAVAPDMATDYRNPDPALRTPQGDRHAADLGFQEDLRSQRLRGRAHL